MERSPVMIGRRVERERTAALVDALVAGRGGALCVIGPPGAGKSRLLAALEEDAAGRVDVHRAAPVQAEHPLAFAAVADLVAPLLSHDRDLPDAQREALRAALALDGPAEPPALAILTAVLGLFDAAARRRPQLVIVDDAHALDLASLPAVGFLARRAGLRALGVVLAARPEGDDLAELEGIPRLPLDDLGPDEARELLGLRGCASAVATQVAAALGGNPLALTEASAALSPDQRAGRVALPDPLPVGRTLEATYARRVDALPAGTRDALVIAASATTSAAGPIAAALRGTAARRRPGDDPTAPSARDPAPSADVVASAGGATRQDLGAPSPVPATAAPEPARSAATLLADRLSPAEDAGLVALDPGHVRFVHPLMRQGVLRAATPAQRRAAHAALAGAVPGAANAWHRAAAVIGPDEDVAVALDDLAADARARGAPGVAARALERAADLSTDPAGRGRRRLDAAVAAGHASRPAWALRLLEVLLEDTDDPALLAAAVEQRGTALLQEGRPQQAAAVFEAEARRAKADEPVRAALLLIRAGAAHLAGGGVLRLGDLAKEASALLPPEAQAVPGIMEALALTATGEHDRARELLRAAKPVLDHLDPCGEGHEILSITAFGLTWLEELDEADALLWRCVTAAREQGAAGPLALPLATRGPLDLRMGAWDRALEHAEEVIALADATDSGFAVSLACSTAAWVHAVRGDEDLSRSYAERSAAVGTRHDLGHTVAYASAALGLMHLSAGRPGEAAAHLERSHRRSANKGTTDPGFVATAPDLVEALLTEGRRERAETVAAAVEVAAQDGGGPWALAGAARCRLLLARDEDLDGAIPDALATAERLPSPFDAARSRLVVGERLRRARRRSDARAPLADAADAFADMRAVPWERRARSELAACGGRTGPDDGARPDPGASPSPPRAASPPAAALAELTERELAVCALVVEGRTNREVAAVLHLSPRTVEHHLRQTYRKLGVRTRTALAARWRGAR